MTVIVPDGLEGEALDAVEEVVEEVVEIPEVKEEEEEEVDELSYTKMEEDSVIKESEIEELRKQVIELQEKLQIKEAEGEVAIDVAKSPELSSMSQKLVNLYIKDKGAYKDLVEINSK